MSSHVQGSGFAASSAEYQMATLEHQLKEVQLANAELQHEVQQQARQLAARNSNAGAAAAAAAAVAAAQQQQQQQMTAGALRLLVMLPN